jgi:phosphoribosylformimino-5-aminoimidazole carboxamide ribonucleotide (ProFAR) isomerase
VYTTLHFTKEGHGMFDLDAIQQSLSYILEAAGGVDAVADLHDEAYVEIVVTGKALKDLKQEYDSLESDD